MASFTLTRPDIFPDGTTVGAYAVVGVGATPSSGAPPGSAVESQVVSAGSATFTNLADSTGYIAYAASPDRYVRFRTSAPAPSGGGTVLPTKRVTGVIAGDASTTKTGTTVADVLQRFLVQLPVATTRWRLRIRNFQTNALASAAGTAYTATFVLTDLYMGPPVYSSGGWQGNMASCANVLAGLTPPSDGSEYITPWVTAAGSQFVAQRPSVLSIGLTGSSANTYSSGSNSAFYYYGTGAAAAVGTPTPAVGGATSSFNNSILDIRLEYEFVGTQPVVLVIGDSIAAGYIDHGQPSLPGLLASWPGIAALRGNFAVINAGRGGGTYKTFSTTAGGTALARFDLATTVPDIAILACGSNDAVNANPLATFQTDIINTVNICIALGIKKIIVATPPPRAEFKPGVVMTSTATASTTLPTSIAYANAEVVQVDYLVSGRSEQLTVSGASTGSQPPYTTTFTAATTHPHDQGATISLVTEARRRDYNEYVRTGVPGAVSVIDFSWGLGDPANRNQPAFEFYGGSQVHPVAPGMGRMAEIACAAITAS